MNPDAKEGLLQAGPQVDQKLSMKHLDLNKLNWHFLNPNKGRTTKTGVLDSL